MDMLNIKHGDEIRFQEKIRVTPHLHGAQWKLWGPAVKLRSSDRTLLIDLIKNTVTPDLHLERPIRIYLFGLIRA